MGGKSSKKSKDSSLSFGSDVSTREKEKASQDLVPTPYPTEQRPLSVGLKHPEENPQHVVDIPSQPTPLPSYGEHHEQKTSNFPQMYSDLSEWDVSTQEKEKASGDLPALNPTEQSPLSVGLNHQEENSHHNIDTSTISSQPTPLPSNGEHREQNASNSPEIRKVSRQERRRVKREKAKFKGEHLDDTSINVAKYYQF